MIENADALVKQISHGVYVIGVGVGDRGDLAVVVSVGGPAHFRHAGQVGVAGRAEYVAVGVVGGVDAELGAAARVGLRGQLAAVVGLCGLAAERIRNAGDVAVGVVAVG